MFPNKDYKDPFSHKKLKHSGFPSPANDYIENPINSFIEQYICCKSKIFIEYPINMYSTIKSQCKCSTFSSFIRDYRLYFLHLPSNTCLNILNL